MAAIDQYRITSVRKVYTALLLLLLLISSAQQGASVKADGDNTLRSFAQARGFYVGAAVNTTALRAVKTYQVTLSREYNMVVAENVMKMGPLRPTQDTFDFNDA